MTTTSSGGTISDVTPEIISLKEFFTDAQAHLRSGKVVDMTGLDQRIADVCKAVQQSDPEKQRTYLPELTALIELLNSYEKDLRQIQAILDSKKAEG